jgi:hypothetical protein
MSADYNHEIGYERLLKDFERYQKESPSGISLKRNRNTINLQFKIGNNKRNPYGCNCSFTLDGMVSARLRQQKPIALSMMVVVASYSTIAMVLERKSRFSWLN